MAKEEIESYKDQISYSTCNEDSLSELKALQITDKDTVICITGSGGRTLNLLAEQPKKIISVDFNKYQNYMLELKIAAIRSLNYEGYARFLGLRFQTKENREKVYLAFRKDLSKPAAAFWDKNIACIRKGVLYQGKFERHYLQSSNFIKFFRRGKVKKMFSFSNLEEQKKFYYEKWDNWAWDIMLTLDANESNYKRTIKDPAYFLYVKEGFDYKKFFHNSLEKAFTTGLAKENHFLALTIDGSYKHVTKLPVYLDKKYYATIKKNLDKIEIVTDSLEHYLSTLEENVIDKFSLSDVSGYLTKEEYEKLMLSVIKTGTKDSIFCYRNFIAKQELPEIIADKVERNYEMEKELEETDLAFVYSFVVGKNRG